MSIDTVFWFAWCAVAAFGVLALVSYAIRGER